MMTDIKPIRLFGSIMLSSLISQGAFAASNIDTTDKYAWNTNSGWVNFNSTNSGVTVYNDHLEGYAWAENIGWVRLGTYTGGGTHTYINTSTDYGINNDGAGNLSGYAWSSNVGWINFNPSNSQVTLNATTGDFDGYAWSENVGWVHFQKTGSPAYKVRYKVLNAPMSLNGSAASETQINLFWTDNSTNETGFKVERTGLFITTAADVTSYSDSGLFCGTTYSYSVKSTNANGDSTAITASATTAACAPTTSSYYVANPNNFGGKEFTDDVVEENSSISNAVFEGDTVENNGLISNSTIGPNTTLTGGKLTGTIINEGIIADVNFVGIELRGGTLSGYIVNSSKVDGIIGCVRLAKGAVIKGGKLGCKIRGNPEAPALIIGAQILPGTYLSDVRLGPTVELPTDVFFGPGVILLTEPPTLADFGLAPEDIAKLNVNTLVNYLSIFSVLTAEEIAKILPEAFAGIKPAQIAVIQKEALGSMTTEQFKYLPVNTLSGLTADNMGGLSTEVIAEFTPKHLDALDVKDFKAMPSEDVSKLFTHFNAKKITPSRAAEFLPQGWHLDLKTGVLTAPIGAKLTLQSFSSASLSTKNANSYVALPTIPNLDAGFGVGGAGTPLMEETQRSLATEENLANFVLSQDEKGTLLVEGTGDSEGIQYAFIPDADNAIQVNTDKIPIGLSTGAGGFYTITTPEGLQFRVIPAPKDPIALSETLGGSDVVIGKRGDVMVEWPVKTRRGGARRVLIFDPFVEPAPEDICVELENGETICEFDNAPEHVQPGLHLPTNNKRSARAGEQAKVVYPDGTAQTVLSTVLSPDTFIQEGMEIDGVKRVLFKANGSFYAFYQGKHLWVRPNFDVKTETTEDDGTIAPRIEANGKNGVTYTIQIDEPTQTRRGGARQILIFYLFIEPAPEDLCVELETGETFCEFDNAAEHVQFKRD